MKSFLSFVIVFAILAMTTIGFAEGNGPVEKLGRGLWNATTAISEIPESVAEDRGGTGMIAGKTHGFIEGVSRFIVRTLTGVVEVATFPLPWPNGYEPILDSTEGFKPDRR